MNIIEPTGEMLLKAGYENSKVNDALKVGIDKANDSVPKKIGEAEVRQAFSRLETCRNGKTKLDSRIKNEEEWWKIRHWEMVNGKTKDIQPSSAWTFNAIINKHADLMDSIPKATCLAREESDEQSAKILTEIFPVVLEGTSWEDEYSHNSYYFIKHGVSAYRVTWDNSLCYGIGDVKISSVDVLNLFWDAGITDIQKSRDVFEVELISLELLKAKYPQYENALTGGDRGIVGKYLSDADYDDSDKALVINWYYKKKNSAGKTVLHYCKFCGDCVLYASENDPLYSERGFYDHGKYPYVIDVMYPIEGTCYGFGVIEAAKNPQLAIDCLDASIMRYAKMKSTPRYWKKKDVSFKAEDFADWSKHIVEVDGSIDEEKLRAIQVDNMDGFVTNIRNEKIVELKETIANRDVNSGGTSGGATSGTAIATLQEAGNKVSRDLVSGRYRKVKKVFEFVIELMRQFYDEPRTFRIISPDGGKNVYEEFDNAALKEQRIGAMGEELIRMPIYDISVVAEKKNPFSTLAQNETIVNLWNMGAFNPENAQAAQIAIDLMEFEGKEKVLSYIKEGQTLYNIVQQQAQQIQQYQTILGQMQGVPMQAPAQTGAMI